MKIYNDQPNLLRVCNYLPTRKFLSALNESRIGVVICDRQFRYRAVNESLAKMNNLSIKEHLGRSFHEVMGQLSEEVLPYYEKVFATGTPVFHLELAGKLLKRSRSSRWIQNIFPFKNGRGRIMEVGSLVTEVVDQAPLHSHFVPTASSIGNPVREADS